MSTAEKPALPVVALPTVPLNTAGVRTRKHRQTETLQLVALCGILFLSGWTDGCLGPLIPKIQEFYELTYTIVSLIFVFKWTGYVLGAFANIWLTKKLGFGNVLLAGSMLQIFGNTLQAIAIVAPFEVFVLGNFLNGVGLAAQNSQSTGYVASLRVAQETKMGIFQAFYGLGALVGPLASTQFAQLRRPGYWAFTYIIGLGLTGLNMMQVWWVFRGRRQEDCLARIGQVEDADEKEALEAESYGATSTGTDLPSSSAATTVSVTPGASEYPPTRRRIARSRPSHIRQMMSLKAVHTLALFLFVYVGTEVAIGGWIVSFMIEVRGGGADSGYISAGFWGGLMIGRVALLPLNKWLGEVRAIYVYTATCIGLELLIWLVPNFFTSAIAVSLVGLLLGPMFPIGMNHAARILPPWLLTASISWISGISIAGAAVLPFVTGAIAGRAGIQSLQPVTVGMLVGMGVLWVFVPTRRVW
ncbi:MFS domain-containing protein [Mycena kentingensis (nom. inval.)]|nr:MFS domain-containing protein [Mycena kentingensis (nom. inval.)]